MTSRPLITFASTHLVKKDRRMPPISDPYKDPMHCRTVGHDAADDLTQSREVGEDTFDHPTQGTGIEPAPDGEPTRGREVAKESYDDPTQGRRSRQRPLRGSNQAPLDGSRVGGGGVER